MEKSSIREAILKAESLLGVMPTVIPSVMKSTSSTATAADTLALEALFAKVFGYFKRSLPLTAKAVSYLQGRGLDYSRHEVGYNSGGLHTESKNHHLVDSMVKYGLLKPRAVQGYTVWGRECVIFPLRNAENKIVSLYGRSISNNDNERHFYLSGRSGLYPCYPSSGATRLILTESVIDAASLLQVPALSMDYEVLALYGTNGLTAEHEQAIVNLPALKEIIFILDGDESGRAATTKHANALLSMVPRVKISQVVLPDGEDVNSVLVSHDDSSVLLKQLEDRQELSFYAPPPSTIITTITNTSRLNTANADLLLYDGSPLQITVLGGIKLSGLDRLRVTLKVIHSGKPQQLPLRHHLDLYNHGHSEQLTAAIVSAYDMSQHQVSAVIGGLTSELEDYRVSRMESMQAKPRKQKELSAAECQAAISYLQSPELLRRTGEDIGRSGIIGEVTNRLIAYLVYSSRKQSNPLHIMFLGSSGSGKTYLQEKVSALIPTSEKIEITQVTENAFYYFKQDELKHKLLLIEDLDGAETSLYPLRELQSKKRITKTVTLKDTKGNLKTVTVAVDGPVSVSGCTTRERLYEDNANRCLLLYVDGSKAQDHRIMEYQRSVSSGKINHREEQGVKQLFCNIQQVLQPIRVVNPYAGYIRLPEQIFKPRRTMTLLLSFIETVTWYHQYQRPVKRDSHGAPYIETTPEDIRATFSLLKEVLFSKSDELAKATRNFLEQLKSLLIAEDRGSITAKEIRERLRINPGNLKRYLSELERYGYVKGSGNRYRHYEYSVTDPKEYELLKSSIDKQLEAILADIGKAVSGSVVQ